MVSVRGHAAISARCLSAPLGFFKNEFPSHLFGVRSRFFSTEEYVRVDPVEHVLMRPGMYVGATTQSNTTMWVRKDAKQRHFAPQPLSYTPALYKIFDEILANAADNAHRDMSMKTIQVNLNKKSGTVSIFNDGTSIPVRLHETEGIYIPELVLGNLMTGSNFDDGVGRLTGGRHGFGAKLTNIFSLEFTIECGDEPRGLMYRQTWKNNMIDREDPIITPLKPGTSSFVRATFLPDYARFNLKGLRDDDTYTLMERRVIDVAGVNPHLEVSLNGKVLELDSFRSYAKLYDQQEALDSVYAKPNPRWEVVVTSSEHGDFEQFSFVNSLTTFRGGTHVSYVADQIARTLAQQINQKKGKLLDQPVTAHQVKSHMRIFVNCLIENPSFDSQTKEYLETPASQFGSTCDFRPKFFKEVYDTSGIVDKVVDWARAKQQLAFVSKMKSSNRKKLLEVPKLEDANDAGTDSALDCSLILTEGDSAKALAVAGLSVVGRDKFGVFPLKGKMLNVRDASMKQILNNQEIKNIISILNLDMRKKYKTDLSEDAQGLRYGKIIIMADQDHDGSHIKGLLLNMLACFWPELLQKKNFVSSFNTPIIKVRKKGSSNRKGGISFFNIPEYDRWKQSLSDAELDKYVVKYYKGLGTSTADEAREYFSNIEKHLIPFSVCADHDFERLDMAFRSHRAADRREWLSAVSRPMVDSLPLESSGAAPGLPVSTFVDNELVLFSHADNARSIGSCIDGLKPSQRKVLYACFKRNLTSEIKVAQLAGYVSEHAAYHHGEASLQGTIAAMAQDFVGSNNIPLLYPSGQFGTRLQGGKDAASARYIFTRLQPVARMLFPAADDSLLPANNDDGFEVEPVTFVPIIPMALVNGNEGIGTGWSTNVPKFNPLDIIDYLVATIDGTKKPGLLPWVRGFQGIIRENVSAAKNGAKYESVGTVEKKTSTTVEITELPIDRWTEDQKAILVKLVGNKTITSFRENHTEEKVSFTVSMKKNQLLMMQSDRESLLKTFKLITPLRLSNMHLFDSNGAMKKFLTPEEVIKEYFPVRLDLYKRRKANELALLDLKQKTMNNKARFVSMVSEGKLELHNRSKQEMIEALSSNGFDTISALRGDNDECNNEMKVSWKEYEYLLKTPLWHLSKENVQEILKDRDEVVRSFADLEATEETTLWKRELSELATFLLKQKGYKSSLKASKKRRNKKK